MPTTDQINELHRLYWSERWPIRKIERHLRMSWRTHQEISRCAGASSGPAAARK
jgi:hypothetical protein